MKIWLWRVGSPECRQAETRFHYSHRRSGEAVTDEIDLKKILNREAEDIQMRASDILYIPNDHLKEALIRPVRSPSPSALEWPCTAGYK